MKTSINAYTVIDWIDALQKLDATIRDHVGTDFEAEIYDQVRAHLYRAQVALSDLYETASKEQ